MQEMISIVIIITIVPILGAMSHKVKTMSLEAKLLGFKYWFCHFPAVEHGSRFLTSLCFTFSIYQMGIIIVESTSQGYLSFK